MKKKIVIALIAVSFVFLLGGIYIVASIQKATSELDHLIKLHQVEILREHLLLQIRQVQSDLTLKDTRHARSIDFVIANVRNMEKMTATCYDCHHAPHVEARLNDLNRQTQQYKDSFSRALTIRAHRERVNLESDRAFKISEQLMAEVDKMVHIASSKLYSRTDETLEDIARTKTILYILVALTPFVAAGMGYIVIREITKPIKIILEATRKVKGGDLEYKIGGLRDEYAEVATSFNEMSTALQQNIRKVEASEKRYRMLFESAGDAIFILEAEGESPGKIVATNPAAAKMHDYSMEEMLKLKITDLDGPEAASEAPERIKRMLAGEWLNAEITHRKKDGTLFPVEISCGVFEVDGHKYILAFDRDISERKRMENLILQSKTDWEDTFNTITDMITVHDANFNIIAANAAAKNILGLPFLETNQVKCYQFIHGHDQPPADCPSCRCLDTQKPATFEIFEPHLEKFLEIRAMPRFNKDKQMVGLIHVMRDITERKQVEKTLQRAEQLKIVGEWAAGLAHEIKNPLAGIKASIEMLAEEVNVSAEDKPLILKAVDEIKRIETLLKSLLNFAKPPKPQLVRTDVNEILSRSIDFALQQPALLTNQSLRINIVRNFDTNIPKILADPMQLQQVFLNLLLNAVEAMPKGGIITLKTNHNAAKNTVDIEISDSGKGIEKEMIDQIFQPFVTTKRKGTGLGLAITRRLIEQQGGEITVKSRAGQGTVFNISLQVKEEMEMAV